MRPRPLLALAAVAALAIAAPAAEAVVSPGSTTATRSSHAHPTPTPATPSPAPATSAAVVGTTPVASTLPDDEGGGTPGGDGNWMAANGLTSPLCAASRTLSCQGSGTVTIPAPPGHYAFDTWTKGGTLGMPTWNGIVSSVLGFLWSLIVQVTVAVFSLLEWAMSFNLTKLGGGSLQRVHLLNASWGIPVAAVMLAIGAIWVAIQTFSQRKIGGALASVATGFLTMGVCLAVVTSPAGTIGRLTDLTADLGRQAAAAPLQIAMPNARLEDGMRQTWQVVIERPFSLLEFGDADWGSSPNRLEPKLVQAARKIARHQGPQVMRKVAAAQTNAALLAVWPSNSDERNSRKADKCGGEACLLNVMCGGEDLEHCKGPMARYAKARLDEGVMARVQEVPIIGLGMLSVWTVFGAIAVGLLWSFVSIIKNVVVLAYLWVLVLTFKAETRRKATDVLVHLIGSALALVAFGIAAGVALTLFLVIQSLGLPWMAQWVLSIIAMIGLFIERHQVTGLMKALLSQPERTVSGGGFAARLASSYATGLGLGMLRGASRPTGAGAGLGGGLPAQLPSDPTAGDPRGVAPGGGGPSRRATAAAALAAGAVAGPLGSAVAAGVMQRKAIAAGAKDAAGRVADGAQVIAAPAIAGAGSLGSAAGALTAGASAWNASVPAGVLAPAAQTGALLAGQQAYRIRRGEQAAAALHGAGEEVLSTSRAYADAAARYLATGPEDPMRDQVAADLSRLSDEQSQAVARAERLQRDVDAGQQAQTWDPADASSPAAARAATWLDSQATTAPAQRAYGQLAAMHGVSPSQWRAMPHAGKDELRGRIDDALALRTPTTQTRPTALEALGHVAAGQPWWGQR